MNLEPVYLQAVSSFEAGLREFLIILGLDPDTEVILEGTLEPPGLELDADWLIEMYLPQPDEYSDDEEG